MTNIDPNKAVSFIIENAPKYAEAKSQRVYLENYLKVKKADLVMKCNENTITRAEHFITKSAFFTLR